MLLLLFDGASITNGSIIVFVIVALLLLVEVFIVDGGTIMCNITTLIVIC